MHALPRSLLLSALLVSTAVAQDARPATAGAPAPAQGEAKAQKPVYDEAADARADVAAAVARAKKENKRVLIQWGANWCAWCKKLAATMKTSPELGKKLIYEYEVVHVDVAKFDKNIDLAKELGAEFKGIPFLTVLDGSGKPIAQRGTDAFEKGDAHDPQKVLAWLTQNESKPLDANTVVDAAVAAAREQHKTVFLHFGAPWCGWCHRLENWMAQPEIAATLAASFVDCKVDNDRMAGGSDVYKEYLAKTGQREGGIPWFVFVDGEGNVVAHSNGPKGNTGFPYQPDEVDHFATMLRAAKVPQGSVDMLRTSLEKNRVEDQRKAREKAPPPGDGVER